MKIIICGTIAAATEILEIQAKLEAMGHAVEIPHGVKHEYLRNRTEVETKEKASDKISTGVIKAYYEKIKEYDAVLIVNPPKRGIANYIGGNTFLEMGFAYVLGKPIYCLNPLPELSYSAEMLAMQPVILNGDLGRFK